MRPSPVGRAEGETEAIPTEPRWLGEVGKRHVPWRSARNIGVLAGDLDGDGWSDVVQADLGILLNEGGVFAEKPNAVLPGVDSPSVPGWARVLVDVDHDGDLDIVTAGGFGIPERNRLFLNDGTGAFLDATQARMPTTRDRASVILAEDVNGDNHVDLYVSRMDAIPDEIYLNDGNGFFLETVALPTSQSIGAAVGDFDQDGDPDLAVSDYGGVTFLQNAGAGVFVVRTVMNVAGECVVAGDIDGDGDEDLVVGRLVAQVRCLVNQGAWSFVDDTAARLPTAIDYTLALSLTDVDGDAALDLLIANQSSTRVPPRPPNRLYLNDGNGVFGPVSVLPADDDSSQAVLVEDFNGDGDRDVYFGNDGLDRLHLNSGLGTFVEASTRGVEKLGPGTVDLAIGDLDGDADLDVFEATTNEGTYMQRNDGFGRFDLEVRAGAWAGSVLALADFDADGDLDVIAVRNGGPSAFVLLNDGTGNFTLFFTVVPFSLVYSVYGNDVVTGDIDGDGDQDIVVVGGTRVLLNNGDATFVDGVTVNLPWRTTDRAGALLDADLDGDLDLVLAEAETGVDRVVMFRNDGTGMFVDVTATAIPATRVLGKSIAVGDVNGDGWSDLVIGGDRTVLFLADGAGGFIDPRAASTGRGVPGIPDLGVQASEVVLGDWDGDGDLDLFVAVPGVQGVQGVSQTLENDGTGVFSLAGPRASQRLCVTAGAADFDGDGDTDLFQGTTVVFLVGSGRGDRVLMSLRRQLESRFVLRASAPAEFWLYGLEGEWAQLWVASAVLPQPVVSPYGVFHLDPATTVMLPATRISPTTGLATVSVTLPPTAPGQTLYAQALYMHGGGPGAWRLSNLVVDQVTK